MSVSINGTGSITGLSVGGLPDGSVDADSIAAGAVTDAKIGTGINAAKLADGTVTSTELQYINSLSSNAQTQISGVGGGKILQVIGTTGSSSTAATSNSAWVNYDTLGSITPASTSNKILISLSYTMYAHTGGADVGGGAKIVRDTTDIGTTQTLYVATGGTPALQLNLYTRIFDAPSSTSAVPYHLFLRAQYGATLQTGYEWECVFMEVEV